MNNFSVLCNTDNEILRLNASYEKKCYYIDKSFSENTSSFVSNFLTGTVLCLFETADMSDTPELLSNLEALKDIAKLENNWNENGALAFSQDLIKRVSSLLRKLFKQPDVFPTARESIQCEYEKENGDYLEFEIFENGTIKQFSCNHNGNVNTASVTEDEMCEAVIRFYQ